MSTSSHHDKWSCMSDICNHIIDHANQTLVPWSKSTAEVYRKFLMGVLKVSHYVPNVSHGGPGSVSLRSHKRYRGVPKYGIFVPRSPIIRRAPFLQPGLPQGSDTLLFDSENSTSAYLWFFGKTINNCCVFKYRCISMVQLISDKPFADWFIIISDRKLALVTWQGADRKLALVTW